MDLKFKSFLMAGLVSHGFNVPMISSMAEVSAIFQTSMHNVLILDTDTVITPVAQLTAIADKHAALIILLGIKNAVPFLIGGVKGAVSKPDDKNEFGKKIFVRNIAERIELHLRNLAGARTNADPRGAIGINDKMIVIASSTGGTEALPPILSALPAKVPPILIVQHMPSLFTYQFAARLDRGSKFAVKEAAINDFARENQAVVAPGDFHIRAVNRGGKLALECFKGDKMHGVRPAADILFESVASMAGQNVIGVILTGMGADGARGLHLLKRKGAVIIGQDEASCVVYGMPRAAAKLGILDFQLPLNQIAGKIAELI